MAPGWKRALRAAGMSPFQKAGIRKGKEIWLPSHHKTLNDLPSTFTRQGGERFSIESQNNSSD